jgi:peptidoglycan/LPS O-acetylase OafA/YrhL
MPELDSIRGLACLAVLCFHGLWWYIPANARGVEGWLRAATQEGFRGVNLFFVLSGFLITGILLDSRDRSDYFARFYKRRALRILPAYYLMLILLALYGVPRAFLGISLLHAANMAPTFHVPMAYGPLWSLGVEEQFYLLWPAVVWKLRTRVLALLALGLFLNSIILPMQLHATPDAAMPLWFSTHGLALGALVAMFLRSEWASRQRSKWLVASLAMIGFGLLWLSRFPLQPQLQGTFEGMAWDVLFSALVLCALLAGSSRFEEWVRPKWLLFFGKISYGLYLIHVLVFASYRRLFHPRDDLRSILLEFAVCSLISIALATLSRYTIEEWFLSLKDRPLRLPIAAPAA